MINTSSNPCKQTLDRLCELLYKGDKAHLETELIKQLKEMYLHAKRNLSDVDADLCTIETLYSNFNSYFADWIRAKNESPEPVLARLHSPEHHNVLIGNCAKFEDVDDLMYELKEFVSSLQNVRPPSELEAQFSFLQAS